MEVILQIGIGRDSRVVSDAVEIVEVGMVWYGMVCTYE